MCFVSQRHAIFRQPNFQKCSEPLFFFLTCTYASRHSGETFFNTWTLRNCPTMVCFAHFDLQKCFAAQRRALFRHLNFQKRSAAEVFWTFWLEKVLLAAAACNFWFLLWRPGSAPAALASLLFDPPGPQIIEKTQQFATFLTLRRLVSSFCWRSHRCILSSNLLSSDSTSLLCFSSLHIVGSLNF